MKLLTILLFFSVNVKASDFYRDVKLLDAVDIINIYNDTTITGTFNAQNKILNIYGKITGPVTIINAIIIASPYTQIFDTSVNIGTGCKIEEMSVMWYGAVVGNVNSWAAFQKSIDQCESRFNLYVPRGGYRIDSSLLVANLNKVTGKYLQTSIKMRGEASFWDDNSGTKITYTGNGFALGLQLNKGSEIHHLYIAGGWISPNGVDSVYFNIPEASYNNLALVGNGKGIWIDPYYDGGNSGSTGCSFHDLKIEKFQILIKVSNNSGTQNGEIMIFRDIQLGAAKYGVVGSQPQEKMNVFESIHSWGAIFCIFKLLGSGNYYISNVNIAGYCSQIFDIVQLGYFPLHLSNIYAEHFARLGRIITQLPVTVSNSLFDFAYPSQAGYQNLLTIAFFDGLRVKFDNCTFRYYGQGYPLKMPARATYENCYFSGAMTDGVSPVFVEYSNGISILSSKIIQITDTLQSSNIRMTIRSSK